MMNDQRRERMPIHSGTKAEHPGSWPFEPFERASGSCYRNHSQTPERLAQRGGLGPLEALAVLTGREFWDVRKSTSEVEAVHLVGVIVGEPWPPPVFNFEEFLLRQALFSYKTWGPGYRAERVLDHIRKELEEIEAAPKDLEEWIDVVILALDGARRTDASPEEIIAALVAKQDKNESREWPDWRTVPGDQAIQHIKSDGGT